MIQDQAALSAHDEPSGFRPDAGRRDRSLSLLATIAVHLVLALIALMVLPPNRSREASPESTLKAFSLQAPSPEAPALPHAAVPRMRAAEPPRPAAKDRATQAPTAGSAAARAPVEQRSAPVETPALPVARPRLIEPPLPPPSPPPASQADDGAALLARYQALIWETVNSRRPSGAGFSGTAIIRFRITRDGRLESASVLRGSGILMLDRLALRAVRQAAPYPPPPAGTDDGQLVFDIPVQFR